MSANQATAHRQRHDSFFTAGDERGDTAATSRPTAPQSRKENPSRQSSSPQDGDHESQARHLGSVCDMKPLRSCEYRPQILAAQCRLVRSTALRMPCIETSRIRAGGRMHGVNDALRARSWVALPRFGFCIRSASPRPESHQSSPKHRPQPRFVENQKTPPPAALLSRTTPAFQKFRRSALDLTI